MFQVRYFYGTYLSGIVNKKKKDRLVWDDVVNKWVPQFGFKKKQAEDEKNWCIPIKVGAVFSPIFRSRRSSTIHFVFLEPRVLKKN